MDSKRKKMFVTLAIILGPVVLIMTGLSLGYVDTETLGRWDLAISIGAIVTLLILLLRKKR